MIDTVVEERERERKLALSPESEVKFRMHHAMLCRLAMMAALIDQVAFEMPFVDQ